MRVISGTARGRKLREPAGMDIRPTTDMVKESLFNIIQFDIEGRRVLDLFAGTGQLGIVAKIRGAAHVTFTDMSREAVKLVRENAAACGFKEGIEVLQCDSIGYLSRGVKYDLIFVDPPYDTELIDMAIEKIIEFDILKENGIIMCESKADRKLGEINSPYALAKEYRYGKIKLTKIVREAGE